jgi:2-(1,2-epoxy-1,2-dihydrophenyl)acetyl-CoA isomerase
MRPRAVSGIPDTVAQGLSGIPDSALQTDVTASIGDDLVAIIEIRRPPENYFDVGLLRRVADALELAASGNCRSVVLCSDGKHFCAGSRMQPGSSDKSAGMAHESASDVYAQALRIFRTTIPIVAAVQGAAVGGGLGLALCADFRVATPESRFAANFARLGFHHGFGLTASLPATVGLQNSLDLLYTGRRIDGNEALRIGLCDRLADPKELRAQARALAADIAMSAPLAIQSIRATMRAPLLDEIQNVMARECQEQERLRKTSDFDEGLRAMSERRVPHFHGL